jgi:hypothetical protein
MWREYSRIVTNSHHRPESPVRCHVSAVIPGFLLGVGHNAAAWALPSRPSVKSIERSTTQSPKTYPASVRRIQSPAAPVHHRWPASCHHSTSPARHHTSRPQNRRSFLPPSRCSPLIFRGIHRPADCPSPRRIRKYHCTRRTGAPRPRTTGTVVSLQPLSCITSRGLQQTRWITKKTSA